MLTASLNSQYHRNDHRSFGGLLKQEFRDGIGDIVLFSQFLEAYRNFYADCRIDLLLTRSACDLLKSAPVNEIIPFNRKFFQRFWIYRTYIFWKLQKNNYSLIVYPAFTRHPNGDDVVRAIKAPQKIGFAQVGRKNDLFTTAIVPNPEVRMTANWTMGRRPDKTAPPCADEGQRERAVPRLRPALAVAPET